MASVQAEAAEELLAVGASERLWRDSEASRQEAELLEDAAADDDALLKAAMNTVAPGGVGLSF